MRDFTQTINVLVQAFLNDTLQHSNCRACAVGNILGGSAWTSLFCTASGKQIIAEEGVTTPYGNDDDEFKAIPIEGVYANIWLSRQKEGRRLIDASGYTLEELAAIERAFELSPKGNNNEEWMFNGLMAVVDVLAEIHNIDLKEREETKQLFTKPVLA